MIGASPAAGRRASLLLALGLAGCSALPEAVPPASPRADYLRRLEEAGLAGRELTLDWSAAARRALASPTPVADSYRETGYFDAAEPRAVAFAVAIRAGAELAVTLATTPADLPLLVELARVDSDGAWRVVASAADGRTLRHAAPRAERLLLVVQPELLAGGRYTIDLTFSGVLAFPVEGGAARPILSPFGSPRDGGARRHQGIDLAAPRGTRALAAADGVVVESGENELGGRVVVLRTDDGLRLYYAHLDRRLVREGKRVARGEPVGLVGDSGNARGTTPHLHFELSADGEPRDPAPWIGPPRPPAAVVAPLAPLGRWHRLLADPVALATGTELSLPPHLPVRLEAATGNGYRVTLADGRSILVAAGRLGPVARPLEELPLIEAVELRSGPAPDAAPLGRLERGEIADVLAFAGETLLVRGRAGAVGWIERP